MRTEERRFWGLGLSDWYGWLGIIPRDMEKICKEAYPHAEPWANEDTGSEIWMFVALGEGWYEPDGTIEGA